ncbi:hypothetical protein E4U58_006126 [Claviceps cyperi]|nr:hypothetical protein E4U58_006126 [Claviceps cyperi]
MADLIEEERGIILDNPLGHSLDSVREALRNAEGDAQGEAFEAERSSPSLHAAFFDLFSVLFNSAALPSLNSKRRPTLTNNVARVRQCTKKCELPSQHFRHLSQLVLDQASDIDICTRLENHELPSHVVRPLSQLILNQASDIDIWTAVIAVVATQNKDTPPTHQPLSWLPFKYTTTKADAEVFDEICNSTHCAVGGFHQKYFEGHEWNSRAEEAWQRAKRLYSHSEKKWLHLPLQPTEENVCSWLVQDEDDSDSEDYGFDHEYSQELELWVKKRKNGSAVEKHDWGDVLAIGRLAQSEQTGAKELLLKLGNAVREASAQQPTRRFVHAFTLTGTTMETWAFDRSGPYSGATFNAHEEPEKFVQVICGYLMMSDEELGLDTFTEENDGRRRATTCFPAKPIGAPEFDRVVKYSWIPSTWTPEAELLRKANEHRVKGIANVVGYEREIARISKLRDGLAF